MTEGHDPATRPVARRLVLFFPGFEPLGAAQHHGRFVRALDKTGKAWDATFTATALYAGGEGLPGFKVEGQGTGWQTSSEVLLFDWSNILKEFESRPVAVRFLAGIAALATFAFNGALVRYLKTSWRYGFFFFYPLILLAVILFMASAAAGLFAGIAAKAIVFAAVAAGLTALAVRKAHFLLMMDDWAFANALAGGGNAIIEQTRAAFAARLDRAISGSDAEEVLVIGHSLGCVFAVDALGQSEHAGKAQVHLMTTGSSLLKIALDRRADWLRQRISALVGAGQQWLDVQSLTDVISFYGSNPASSVGISGKVMPVPLAIRFKAMLTPQTYARVRYNFFRMHRQFVLAVECLYPYSLHMIACGPQAFRDVIGRPGLTLPPTDQD